MSQDKTLVSAGNSVEVYDQNGALVKRIPQPPFPEEFGFTAFNVWLLDDGKYVSLVVGSNRSLWKTKYQLWEGSLADPD
jgi:hypothetical protein